MNEITPPLPPTKDRSLGLILFGVLTIAMGCLSALFVPLILFGAAMSGDLTSTAQMIPAVAVYGFLAVGLIWLGIGSILKRRWARVLILIGAWSWLLIGVISLGVMGVMAGSMRERLLASAQPMSESAAWMLMLIPGVLLLFIFLILPAIWVFFYRSPHVKATCDYFDPVERWTDRCPVPVLAAVVWLAVAAISCVMMIFGGMAVVPLFGTFVLGWPAKVILVLTGLIWAYGMWGFYRLDRNAWWVVTVLFVLFMGSAAYTYAVKDILEIYPAMGYSPEQVAEIGQFMPFNGSLVVWMTVLWAVPVVAYLGYLRRYFWGK